MKVRYGDFGGWDKKEPSAIDAIHVLFEFRQLACADHTIALHYERWTDLGVAMVARVEVEEEIQKRPLELCALAHVNRETTAADFDGTVGVDEPEALGKSDMILGIGDCWFLPMNADLGVVSRLFANGNGRLWKIGQNEQQGGLLVGEGIGFLSESLHLVGEGFHLGFQGCGVLLLGAEFTDFLAQAVALALEALQAGFRCPSVGVDGKNGVDGLGIVGVAGREAGLSEVGLLPKSADIKHGLDRMNKMVRMPRANSRTDVSAIPRLLPNTRSLQVRNSG